MREVLETIAVLSERALAGCVVRDDLLDAPPEFFAVVGLYEVYEFVDDHVLDGAGREADGTPVEVEVAFWTA